MSMGYDNNYSRGNNGGNDNNGIKEPTTYSQIRFNNPTSNVDKTALRFQYTYGLLNIAIAPKKPDSANNSDYAQYDYNNSISIWISHNHAYILKKEIRRLLEVNDPKKLKNVGVPTKKDVLVCFGYGTDYGTDNFVLSIMKLSADGSIQNSYVYEFTDNGYMSIVNFDINTKKFDKNQIAGLEVDMMLTLLDEYVKSSTGAYAYMNRFYNRFENSKRFEMISGICNQLGVSVGSKANYSNRNGGGFFNNSNNQNSGSGIGMNPPTGGNGFRNSSLDEIGEDYGDDMD